MARSRYCRTVPWMIVIIVCSFAGWREYQMVTISATQAVIIGESFDSGDTIIASVDGKILSWGANLQKLLGYDAKEIVGHPITDLVPPECLEDHEYGWHHSTQHVSTRERKACRNILTKDGRCLRVNIVSEIRDVGGVRIVVADIEKT